MRKPLIFLLVIAAIAGIFSLVQNKREKARSNKPIVVNDQTRQRSSNREGAEGAFQVEEVVRDLLVPWSIVFSGPSRMLVTERPGKVRVVENGKLLTDPLVTFPEVSSRDEEGLMGMVLHPGYAGNKLVYVCLAYQKGGGLVDKVVQFTDKGGSASNVKIILDNIPSAAFHAGCRIKFGPDGKLYITTGDATDRQIAQDGSSLGGKILRLNADGSIPADNPFPGSAVWSLGHRNPQGIDWDLAKGNLWASEHGPSGFDGPGGGDEINLVKKGENYGWPVVSHERADPRFVSPKLVYTPAIAPAGLLVYKGDALGHFKNNIFFGALRGEGLYRVVLNGDSETIKSHSKMSEVDLGRIREVVEGPDGAIYFTTSNRDGRGKARAGDDKIYRITPK